MDTLERIDTFPTHLHGTYAVRAGRPYPFGATLVLGGVNFSVFSKHANYCILVLYRKGEPKPLVEIPFRGMFRKIGTGESTWAEFRVGNVFAMTVMDLDYENIEYGFRLDGPYPRTERGEPGQHRFDPSTVLLDPYARGIGGRDVWGAAPNWNQPFQYRSRVVSDDFDWEEDRPLEIPMESLVIYEAHLRGFTRHPSGRVKHPGTFAGLRQKIPYLKQLGVNCVELLPIFEFDEHDQSKPDPVSGEMLLNYWGYSTVGFFAPKAGYAASGSHGDATMVADELKGTIKALHANGIAVILDVVYNHTAEGNENGPSISFRGIDNATYYMLTPDGHYQNFSGCGNSLNCNNPIVRGMVLDSLRTWVTEYHVDGFRFDAAAILGRDPWGNALDNPPLLESLAYDPILGKSVLIAEAWDAGGLHLLGRFPSYGRFAEWNGKYRDTVRRWLVGETVGNDIMQAVMGSPDLYSGRGPGASINFVTCHDGFTLYDLFAYDRYHNEANGENNDGIEDNHSWNCGAEGPTEDAEVNSLRRRQMRNALAILLTSQGVPMILMGDEVARSQQGNNNAYCHDSETNWLDWTLVDRHADQHRFVKLLLAFRARHPALRRASHLSGQDLIGSGYPDISWHGTRAWNPDFGSRTLAYMYCGQHAKDNYIYVAMNVHWEAHPFEVPALPSGLQWYVFVNSGCASPEDVWEAGSEPVLDDPSHFLMGPRSVAILVGR